MYEEQKIINGIPIVDQWRSYWLWLPTLYLIRGLPYVILLVTSLVYFDRMGLSDGSITLTTSWLILPFVLRPLLGRLVVGYWSGHAWVTLTEFVMALSLGGLAFMVSSVDWSEWIVFFLMIIAAMAALHDVAIERLHKREAVLHDRPAFIGARTISYTLSIIAGMAISVTIAGSLEVIYRAVAPPWATIFRVLSVLLTCLMLLHTVILPKDNIHANLPIWARATRQWWHDAKAAFVCHPHYVANSCLLFALLIPEGMFFRIAPLFLIDPGNNTGLALSPQELGLVLGTVGTFSSIGGSALGANLVRRDGLKRWLWLFVIALTLPKFAFVYLSYYFVSTLSIINLCVIIEQFEAGLGLTLYVIWLAHCTKGEYSTFTYSIGTAVTAFSLVMTGWSTGFLQEYVDYRLFFLLVTMLGVISFIVTYFLPVTKEIEKRKGMV